MDHFVSGDWGTTSFRLRLVRAAPFAIEAEIATDDGVRKTAEGTAPGERSAAFAHVLTERLRELGERASFDAARTPIAISGMASSSIGWRELPYATLPFPLDGSGMTAARMLDAPPTWLLSGVRSADDVMRGEEAELLGLADALLDDRLDGDCLVILPGTHAKHVRLSQGRITAFRTCMTGELLAVLGQHTILAHSIAAATPEPVAATSAAYAAGVRRGAADNLSAALFSVRTNQLFARWTLAENRDYLTGLLLGAELGDLGRRYDDGPILLAAGPRHLPTYRNALELLGLGQRLTIAPPELVSTAAARGQAVVLRHLDTTPS